MNSAPPAIRWVSTQQLQEELQLSVTTLRGLELDGHIQPGKHYIRRGSGSRSPRMWDYDLLLTTLRELTAARPETYSND